MKFATHIALRLVALFVLALFLPACGKDCGQCHGDGQSASNSITCPDCKGLGMTATGETKKCNMCFGTGFRGGQSCTFCSGGRVNEAEKCDRCDGRRKVCGRCRGSGKG